MDSEHWIKIRFLPNVTHICSVNSLIRTLVLVTSKTPIYPSWTLLCLQLYLPPFFLPLMTFLNAWGTVYWAPYLTLCCAHYYFQVQKPQNEWVGGITLDAKILFTHNIGYTYKCSALLYFSCLSVHPLGAYLWTVPLAEKLGGGGGAVTHEMKQDYKASI